MDDPSRKLVERASDGDGLAADALLERFLPELRAFVARRAGPGLERRESTSDLVQSTCREVLQHLPRFRYDGEDGFRRWLFKTALRKIQDRHCYWQAERRRAERETTAEPLSPSRSRGREGPRTSATPSRAAAASEELERVARALAELPESYREVIRLHQVEGLSHQEIAGRLGTSEAYARTLLSRGLARLARVLHRP